MDNNEERNKQAIAKQQEKMQKRSEVAEREAKIEDMSADELRARLSNKNQDYIFRLEKFLKEEGMSADDAKKEVDGMLQDIVVAQNKGVTAGTLFEMAPQEKAHEIVHPKPKPRKLTFKEKFFDNALLYITIFGAIVGLFALMTPKGKAAENGTAMGILSLIIIGILCGLTMTYFNDALARPREDRPAGWKLILIGVGAIFVLFIVAAVLAIPPINVINPVLPGGIDMLVAAVAYGGRWLWRKTKGITTEMVTPRRR
jgi:uncharacterized membrane-anchored protein